MKTIVVYNSKTGFSEKYGKWIAQELKCEAVSYKNMTPDKWKECDTIIYGGGVIAGKISGVDKVKARPEVKGKKLVVYTVGATPMDAREIIDTVKNGNLTKEEQKDIPFFYFEGGINYEKMSFFPKLVLKFMYIVLKKKKDKTEADSEMMSIFEKSSDKSSKEYIKPLLEYIKG